MLDYWFGQILFFTSMPLRKRCETLNQMPVMSGYTPEDLLYGYANNKRYDFTKFYITKHVVALVW